MDSITRDVPPELTRAILGSAISVHRELGPGLLESTYRKCLVEQLGADGMTVESEKLVPVRYRGRPRVLLELKAVENLSPVHEAQTLAYLRHTGLRIGLLINFNVPRLMQGVRRFIR